MKTELDQSWLLFTCSKQMFFQPGRMSGSEVNFLLLLLKWHPFLPWSGFYFLLLDCFFTTEPLNFTCLYIHHHSKSCLVSSLWWPLFLVSFLAFQVFPFIIIIMIHFYRNMNFGVPECWSQSHIVITIKYIRPISELST